MVNLKIVIKTARWLCLSMALIFNTVVLSDTHHKYSLFTLSLSMSFIILFLLIVNAGEDFNG